MLIIFCVWLVGFVMFGVIEMKFVLMSYIACVRIVQISASKIIVPIAITNSYIIFSSYNCYFLLLVEDFDYNENERDREDDHPKPIEPLPQP